MSTTVTHINLLRAKRPAFLVAKAMFAVLGLTVGGAAYYGVHVQSQASEAVHRRDDVAVQVKAVQQRMAVVKGETSQNANALGLRQEVEALRLQAQTADALVSAVRKAAGGRSQEFLQAMVALGAVKEPGLWLTNLNVGEGGKRVDLQGQARSGAAVLRFAARANEALRPLAVHLDGLEMQPLSDANATGADAGGVSFRLN
jgi:hypothetical protein